MKKLELMRCYSGSIAYGTNLPTSDVDIRGIYCAEPKSILTPFFVDREMTLIDEEDGKLYELTNYMKLFVDMNPNIIELMFVDRSDILQTSDVYEYLREQAPKLLSSKVAFTFSGYAMAQLKRIKGHNKWINNPQPKEQPTQKEFMRLTHSWMDDNLTKHKDFQKMLDDLNKLCVFLPMGDNIYGVIGTHDNAGLFNSDGSIRKVPYEQFSDEDKKRKPILIVKYLADDHKQAKEKHKNYWTWVENRNPLRHELEEKYGYDCYSFDTEFLTQDGWKFFDDIREDDLLATFDKKHRIVYQKYTERYDNLYTGNLYHFTGYHQDTLVTANHRMYVKDYARNIKKDMSEWKFVEAANLKETYKILNTITPVVNELRDLQSPVGGMDIKIYLQLMGWFVSDGTLMFSNGKPKNMCISQAKESLGMRQSLTKLRNPGKLDFKEYLLEKKDYQNYQETKYVFSREVAEALFKDCGHGERNKRLPEWVFGMTKRKMDILLKSLLQGDGSKRKLVRDKNTYIYHTTNSLLADDVQRLAFMCGYETSKWGPYESSTSFGVASMYQVHINKSPKTERMNNRENLKKVPVTNYRTVCFSVPNGTLVTRRNGKISLHGNCKHALHLVRLMRMAEEILSEGKVLVKRPDAQELLAIRNGAWSLESLLAWAEEKDNYIRNTLYKNTHLPKTTNLDFAADVLMTAQQMCWDKMND